jgi:hypothetical protein
VWRCCAWCKCAWRARSPEEASWLASSGARGLQVVPPSSQSRSFGINLYIYSIFLVRFYSTRGQPAMSSISGDLIPWTMAQQFQDDNFPQLSGARIVRLVVPVLPHFSRLTDFLFKLRLLGRKCPCRLLLFTLFS